MCVGLEMVDWRRYLSADQHVAVAKGEVRRCRVEGRQSRHRVLHLVEARPRVVTEFYTTLGGATGSPQDLLMRRHLKGVAKCPPVIGDYLAATILADAMVG